MRPVSLRLAEPRRAAGLSQEMKRDLYRLAP